MIETSPNDAEMEKSSSKLCACWPYFKDSMLHNCNLLVLSTWMAVVCLNARGGITGVIIIGVLLSFWLHELNLWVILFSSSLTSEQVKFLHAASFGCLGVEYFSNPTAASCVLFSDKISFLEIETLEADKLEGRVFICCHHNCLVREGLKGVWAGFSFSSGSMFVILADECLPANSSATQASELIKVVNQQMMAGDMLLQLISRLRVVTNHNTN